MLEPGSSHSSRMIDDGSQEVVESHQEIRSSPSRTHSKKGSSSEMERTQVRVKRNGVITWLKLGRDVRANDFWRSILSYRMF